MSETNDTSQHSGSTSGSKKVTNHTIFQSRKSELFDMKNHSSITLCQKLLFPVTEKFIFAILKFLTPSNIASMIIACQRKMTPANILVQPPGLKTSLTNHTIFQPRKSELFDLRIIPQLRCGKKLSFHETEKFIFAILKFLTPSNIASMIIVGQRKMTPSNILVQPLGLKRAQIIQYSNKESQNSLTRRIIPQLHCVRKLSFHETENFIFTILTLQLTIPLIIPYEH